MYNKARKVVWNKFYVKYLKKKCFKKSDNDFYETNSNEQNESNLFDIAVKKSLPRLAFSYFMITSSRITTK